MEKVINDNKCVIVKCCASCAYKNFVKDNIRICVDGNGLVKPSDVCPRWEMRKGLEKAGIGGGKIKKKAYLELISRTKEEEEAAYAELPTSQRRLFERTPINELRRRFEEENETIYQNF